jgi:hypothetical protein
MFERNHLSDGLADRRYYHFILLSAKDANFGTYWKHLQKLGSIRRPKNSVETANDLFVMQHRKFVFERGYARGAVAQALSESGNGRPPFAYDLLAFKITFRRDVYVLLGFPFATLGAEVIDSLTASGFLENVEFQGVELGKLLSEDNRPLRSFEGLDSKVVGVQFVVTDDKSLTAVRLGGDDPFHAQIYESFLKKKFEDGVWVPDQCVLACERQAETKSGKGAAGRLLRSRLRIDKTGNFKFYVHAGYANAILMPYAIAQIRAVSCLKQVFGNPLRRVPRDETD